MTLLTFVAVVGFGIFVMRAVIIQEHGGLDRVEIGRVSEPEPTEDEVIVKVRSAGLNHLDIWVREGRPGLKVSMPHVMGSDAAGVVIGVGANVKSVNIGDEVVLNPGLSCGSCEYCNRGEQSECISFGIVGMTRQGTFAEQVAVPARNVFPKPSYMNFDEAGTWDICTIVPYRLANAYDTSPAQTRPNGFDTWDRRKRCSLCSTVGQARRCPSNRYLINR
jgi:NADPH:quinone reductase-like Zn-dependent oxidoreductase